MNRAERSLLSFLDAPVVVGDPDARWRMGGPDVCRQLGIPEHSSGGR